MIVYSWLLEEKSSCRRPTASLRGACESALVNSAVPSAAPLRVTAADSDAINVTWPFERTNLPTCAGAELLKLLYGHEIIVSHAPAVLRGITYRIHQWSVCINPNKKYRTGHPIHL